MLEIFSLLYWESFECLLPPNLLSHCFRVNKFVISQRFERFIGNLHERHAIAKNVLCSLSEVKLKFVRMKFIVFVCAATYEILFMFIAEVIWKQTWINFRSVRHFYNLSNRHLWRRKKKIHFFGWICSRVSMHIKNNTKNLDFLVTSAFWDLDNHVCWPHINNVRVQRTDNKPQLCFRKHTNKINNIHNCHSSKVILWFFFLRLSRSFVSFIILFA